MKRLLLLLPLLLTACGGAADITTEEPFQITCTWDVDGKTGKETYFIDPKLDLVEIVEIKDHNWFVGVQFHPELKSRIVKVHPLFRDFISAAIKFKS